MELYDKCYKEKHIEKVRSNSRDLRRKEVGMGQIINLKHLINETKRHKKKVIVFSAIFGIATGFFYYVNSMYRRLNYEWIDIESVSLPDAVIIAIVGFVMGTVMMSVFIYGKFILDNRIVYPEQVLENTGLKIINKFSEERNLQAIYYNLSFGKEELYGVNFVSLKPLGDRKGSVYDLAEMLQIKGKRILVVEYVSENEETDNLFKAESQHGYSVMKFSDEVVLSEEQWASKIGSVRDQYDHIFFLCEDIITNPAGKIISTHTDATVVIIQLGMVKIDELKQLEEDYKVADIELKGVVF